MFCFFKNDSLVNFWANQVGDIFCESTIRGMKWSELDIDLVFYPSLEKIPTHYEFGLDKELIIKNRHIDYLEEELLDESGIPKIGEDGKNLIIKIEIESFTIDRTIVPVVYFSKGKMILAC